MTRASSGTPMWLSGVFVLAGPWLIACTLPVQSRSDQMHTCRAHRICKTKMHVLLHRRRLCFLWFHIMIAEHACISAQSDQSGTAGILPPSQAMDHACRAGPNDECYGELRLIFEIRLRSALLPQLYAFVQWLEPMEGPLPSHPLTCMQWRQDGPPYGVVTAGSIYRPIVLRPNPHDEGETLVYNHFFCHK